MSGTLRRGLIYGVLGVLGFSLTLPMTRLAVAGLDPNLVGLGRALPAALCAALLLLATRQPLPTRRYWSRFAWVAGGVVIGFPLLSSLAMREVTAAHGAILTGLAPLATALGAVLRGRERPPLRFWISAVAGSALVLLFAVHAGAGRLSAADGLLLGAVAAVAVGYTEGALLTREFGAWQVICWALVLSAPLLAPLLWWLDWRAALAAPASAWLGFLYVSAVSMFLAFIAWYRGLALGGIAQVGQVQLLQPFFTLGFAAIVFGESIEPLLPVCAGGVLVCVALGLRSRMRPATVGRLSDAARIGDA